MVPYDFFRYLGWICDNNDTRISPDPPGLLPSGVAGSEYPPPPPPEPVLSDPGVPAMP